MQRTLAAMLLIWLFGVLAAPSAMAHAVLLETTPADQAVLEVSPSKFVLRFNEPIRPIAIHLYGSLGRLPVPDSDILAIDQEIRVALPQPLPTGTWLLSYRVMSADSHPVAGTIQFSIGPASSSAALPASTKTATAGWHMTTALARLLMFAAIALVVGGVLFDKWVDTITPSSRQRLMWITTAGTMLALLSIGLRGGLLADAHASELAHLKLWKIGFRSSFGNSMACAAIGFVLVGTGLRRAGQQSVSTTGFGIFLILASFALSGHVATATPRWLTAPALLLHVSAMAFWIGALPLLLTSIQTQPSAAYATARRFSRLAMISVAVLAGSGLIIAIIQLGHWHALFSMAYGRLLLLKLMVVASLLGLAAWNKLRITSEILHDPTRGLTRLSSSIRIELTLALIIFAVTAILGLSSPPRTLHQSNADSSAASVTGFSITIPDPQLTATLTVIPARTGSNQLEVLLTQPDGTALTPLEISVDIFNPDLGIEAITRQLTPSGAGRYIHDGSEFALHGTWIVRLGVLITDFDQVTLEASVPIH